ncbi:MAG: ribonuclease H, partial [Candidatus Binataceae bacterium]
MDAGKPLLVYADGSCLGNPGPGGWGVVIVDPAGANRELCGFDPATTNNRMELTAAIEALRSTDGSVAITLRSDSEYLVKSIKLGWKRNKNLDLWRALDTAMAGRKVNLEWVRGHAGDELNDRADQLAVGAARAGMANGAGAAASSIDTPWLAEVVR